MIHTNFNAIQPFYCPSKSSMDKLGATTEPAFVLSEELILGHLGRNVVVNIPPVPTLTL